MPPRRRAAAVPLDVELTRQKLADGKIVRVGISKSAQFPEGAIGRVRGIGDPSVDGDEYIHVELSLGGTRDVVPFAPGDLTPATRAKAAGPPVAAAPKGQGSGNGSRTSGPPHAVNGSSARSPAPGPARQLVVAGSNGSAGSGESGDGGRPAGPTTSTGSGSAAAETPTGAGPAGGPVAARRPGNAAGPGPQPQQPSAALPGGRQASDPVSTVGRPSRTGKRPPPVAITVATSEAEPTTWRIEAKVGARVVLRAGAVSPARVWELVQLLENEALTKAVGSILSEQRAAASARAAALAAELAAVRAELDALPDAGAS